MKKVFEIIGLLSLACFSFFVTDKTISVFENVDNIMIQIKENSYKYNRTSIDAIIKDDFIIPGINGRVVDIKKSYKNMKKYGYYNENMYVYNSIKPNISLSDNANKYIISGNTKLRNVSLLFIVNDEIDSIISVLNKNNIKANFFISTNWFEENGDLVLSLINDGHIIGTIGNNYVYSDSSFGWMDTIIKGVSIQKKGYCYYIDDKDNINNCFNYNDYVLKPILIKNNFLFEVKKYLSNGVMLSFNINNSLIKELDSIIKYINSKGYNIVTVDTLLDENILK